jgi:hypothetical protein
MPVLIAEIVPGVFRITVHAWAVLPRCRAGRSVLRRAEPLAGVDACEDDGQD